MQEFSAIQQEKLKKILAVLQMGDKQDLILFMLQYSEKIEKLMETLEKNMPVFQKAIDAKEELRPKAGKEYPNEKQIFRQIKELVDAIPKPKDADEKRVIKKAVKQIAKMIKQPKDGKDAVVNYEYILDLVMSEIELPEVDLTEVRKILEKETKPLFDAIDELRKEVESAREEFQNKPQYIGGGGTGRFVPKVMVDDFSDSTDGSTKVFTLTKAPRNYNIMKIWGSDFPYILRPNVDFTVANKTLTLTDEVDAPSNGATMIVEYYV